MNVWAVLLGLAPTLLALLTCSGLISAAETSMVTKRRRYSAGGSQSKLGGTRVPVSSSASGLSWR